jgi:hypothetical protein
MMVGPKPNLIAFFTPDKAREGATTLQRLRHQFSRQITWFTLLAFALAGCGGGLSDVTLGKPVPEIATPARYSAALRLAALARVEARGGADEVAAEHFRAAYRKYPDVSFLAGYARSAERAKLYAEAHDALRRALSHALSPDERAQVDAEIARLTPLVPSGLVRVALQVAPEGARVELTRQQPGESNGDPRKSSKRSADRIALGTGWLYLAPGSYAVYSSLKGFQSDLRTLQVTAESADLMAIALAADDAAPQLADTTRPKHKGSDTVEPDIKKPDEGPVVEFQDRPKVRRSPVHTLGPVVLSALGVLAVGAGGFFGWQASQNAASANDLSGQGLSKANYDSQFATYHQAVLNNANFANYALAGGGTLVALGSLWWLLAPSAKAAPASAEAGSAVLTARSAWPTLTLPSLAVSPGGVSLQWPL